MSIPADITGTVILGSGVNIIGSLTANQSVNVAQIAGNTTAAGNGVTNTGTQRVTLSSDSTGQVALAAGTQTIGALTANQSVNNAQVAGTATSVGNGVTNTGTQRVTLSSDGTGLVTKKDQTWANVTVINSTINNAATLAITTNATVIRYLFLMIGTSTAFNNGTAFITDTAGNKFIAFDATLAINGVTPPYQMPGLAISVTGIKISNTLGQNAFFQGMIAYD